MPKLSQNFNNFSLRIKLLLCYSIIFTIIGVSGSIALYSIVKKIIEHDIEHDLKNLNNAIFKMVDTTTRASIQNYLYGISKGNLDIIQYHYDQYRMGKMTKAGAKKKAGEIMLSQRIGKTGYFFAWDISKAPGSVILAVHPKIQGEDVAAVDFVQKGAKLKNGYIEYEWKNPGEEIKRKKSMYLLYFKPWEWVIAASSYRDEFYKLINMENLQKSILSIKTGDTGYPYILDSKGDVIIHPTLQGSNVYKAPDANGRMFIQEICALKNGKMTYTWANPGENRPREKLIVFNYIQEFDWIIASSCYMEEYLQPLHGLQRMFLGLTLTFILLLFLTTFWLSSYLTRPLNKLMKNFNAGAKGAFSVRTDITSKDEIGKLGCYFNKFMQNFEEYNSKLMQSEKKYRSIFENSIEGIFQIDSMGKLISANPSLATIMGYESPVELLSAVPVLDDVYVDPKKYRELLKKLNHQNRVRDFEVQLYKKNRSIIWVSLNIRTVTGKEGKPGINEGSLMDITQRHLTQQIMVHTEKMLSLGGLAAGMAHEINNPLAGMMQNAQVIHNRLTKNMPANDKIAKKIGTSMTIIKKFMEERNILHHLENINEAGIRAATVIKNVLSFAKKSDSNKNTQYLSHLIEKTLKLAQNDYDLKKRYDFKQIKITRDYDPDLPFVFCNGSKIQQVFFNIFKNAADAMHEGNLHHEKPILILRLLKDENMARIEIEDNGPGMDKETCKRIFEPFFTTKEVDKGTGLGLSVSYYIIVEDHKGEMSVESSPGKGTCFIIKLPLGQQVS
ncbi:MAG: cache domain-containing protein [Desulfobacula sp.]|uniref:Cache 3/Cache 2 fusion domain-containing protein n=1 Tax=Desulfobacula sp. TaxID=2593537 RepID=UPI0025B8B6E1|nr:cache domain-containing protein [Desulfobacula sp.]MCD4719869.1 cache domain-containing protein [Desulfobacula sp.]